MSMDSDPNHPASNGWGRYDFEVHFETDAGTAANGGPGELPLSIDALAME